MLSEKAKFQNQQGGVLLMRRFVLATAVLALGVFLTGSALAAEAGIVVSYNTPKQWANWGAVLKAFTEKTGILAPSDPKNSGQTLAALEAESKAPQADVAYYGIVFGIEAARKDLVAPFKPDFFDEIPSSLKDPEGKWFAIHQGSIAFIVNKAELGNLPVPKSWEDLLDEKYAGKVGFLDPTQAAVGYSVFAAGNLALGGTLDNWDPGVQYFKQLVENGLIMPAQTATAMVQQGEIPILIDADFNGYKLKYMDDAPVEIVIPEEGSISIPYVISLVKGAPHEEAGKKFINFALSDEGQKLFARSYVRPIRNVEIDPEISARMLPESDYERVISPDFSKMKAVQATAMERWKSEVIR
jgi:putative spermidine/putrescine transport system substrate-binding protein